MKSPFRTLLTNSGLNADEWLPQVRAAKPGFGIDVIKPDKLVDLKANGIIDPTRVTREALQNAVSIAATASTMGALIVDEPKEDKGSAPDMGAMGGMM